MLLQIVFIVLIAGALIALLMTFRRNRGGSSGFGGFGGFQRTPPEAGTLRITGVSPRPAGQGEQFVTITGNLSGPSVPNETVYGRFAWDANQWPFPGQDLPVLYPPGKPQHWSIGYPAS